MSNDQVPDPYKGMYDLHRAIVSIIEYAARVKINAASAPELDQAVKLIDNVLNDNYVYLATVEAGYQDGVRH